MSSLPKISTPRRSILRRSILRRAIAAVLLIELLTASMLIAVTAAYERHARFRAFDVTLQGRASALLGAVQDGDDPADNIILDTTGIDTPKGDLFEVVEENGRVLGRSADWPFPLGRPPSAIDIQRRHYRFVTLRGVRVVDPGEKGGGKLHHVIVLYGASIGPVQEEVWEAVRFYALTFAAVMLLTAAFLGWLLRRALSPLNELATAAGKVSAQAWTFTAPQSAWVTRELAPLTAAIEASVQRLQQSFEQQRRFTSDAAHELKTDLAIIKSSLQLLAMRRRSAEEYSQGLTVALSDCERLEGAVAEMLTLARVEHASTPGTGNPADFAWHAGEAVRSLMPMAQLKGVSLQVSASAPSQVALSGKDITLLCLNLLQNAVQHSRSGGRVTVEVAKDLGLVTLRIQDEGEGIPPEVLPHIFEPFYRGDEARDRKRGGTGLGLAIAKATCEKAGGTLTLTSEPGRGTLATVCLPAYSSVRAEKTY